MKLIGRSVDGAKERVAQESNEDFVARFCNQLNLPREVTNAANELSDKARHVEGVYGRAYVSVAAACIFIICQLGKTENKRTAKQIAEVAQVAEVTIRAAYKMIYPHLKEVLPDGYKNSESFGNLPVP